MVKKIFKIKENQPEIINLEDYGYILEWAKRSSIINDVKSLFEFIYREESMGEEPLKTAWEKLTMQEQIYLTYELAKLYKTRSIAN